MQRNEVVATILRERLIAIVRLHIAAQVLPVVRAIRDGGIRCIEISLTTPGALDAIREARARVADTLLGAGTVCTVKDAEAAIRAGAHFLVTPVTVPRVAAQAHAHSVPIVMGALTPTEIVSAVQAGADLVKIFPASSVDPGYLKAVMAPLPNLRPVPTGGVDVGNACDWLAAGAVALGVGGALTDAGAIAAARFQDITEHARQLVASIQ